MTAPSLPPGYHEVEFEYFHYEPPHPPQPVELPPYCYLQDRTNDVCYLGRLTEDGSGYHFDGETVTVMPQLWEGDQA